MSELIKINYDSEHPTVNGRELHNALQVKTAYNDWFPRMCKYGFADGLDYYSFLSNRSDGLPGRCLTDHQLSIDMAKQLCMIQRTEIGKKFRQYFIQVEEAWNSPEAIMARALRFANQQMDLLSKKNIALTETVALQNEQIMEMKPKEIFADAVASSKSSILIGDLAKILKQNGVETGQKRLFERLRSEGYLMKEGSSKNMPTQKAMEMGLFEIKETTISNPDGSIRTTKTTKVTGRGQQFFINRYLGGC